MRWFRVHGGWRGTGALLVVLALAVRLTAPNGWMLAPGDHGPRMVICTGHGPEMLGGDPAKAPANQPDKSADHVCVFAGAHSAPTPPAPIAFLTVTPVATDEPPRVALLDQRPGQGLAAPPPPSQGPPDPTA
ncbi:MAG TPA: DUF2946 family protein [Caulobacteraceae bacterium]|nr:DUF2946 family protein [Caulobacteraceae bacterium]